jgi:uncharacterized protein (TIGR02118 family)
MICVSASYPAGEGKTFDWDYYLSRHMKLAVELSGPVLLSWQLWKGAASLDGQAAPFVCVAHLYFSSPEAFGQVMAAHGQTILADIPNYTNIQPVLQIQTQVGSST